VSLQYPVRTPPFPAHAAPLFHLQPNFMHGLFHLDRLPDLRKALQQEEWTIAFSQSALQRARSYRGPDSILSAKLTPQGSQALFLEGSVRGNYSSAYTVTIFFEHDSGGCQFYAECSCPVGYHCKHCAALLYHTTALLSPSATSNGQAEFDHWIQTLSEPPPPSETPGKPAQGKRFLAYCLQCSHDEFAISLHIGTLKKNGEVSINTRSNANADPSQPTQYMARADLLPALLFRQLARSGYAGISSHANLKGPQGRALLQEIFPTERLFLLQHDHSPVPIRCGEALPVEPAWTTLPDGSSLPTLGLPPTALLLPTSPLLALLPSAQPTLHSLDSGDLSGHFLLQWSQGPIIPPEQTVKLSLQLASLPRPLPVPTAIETRTLPKIRPTPRLTLHRKNPFTHGGLHRSGQPEPIVAELDFLYHSHPAPVPDFGKKSKSFTVSADKILLTVPRHQTGERALADTLCKTLDLTPASEFDPVRPESLHSHLPPSNPDQWDLDWARIISRDLPLLKEQGWEISLDTSAKLEVHAIGPDNLDTGLTEVPDHGIDWFRFDASYLTPGGQQQSLLPLLSAYLLTVDPAWLEEGLRTTDDDDETILRDPSTGAIISINTRRLLTLAKSIHDLFGFSPPDEAIHRIQAAGLADSLDGSATLRALADLGRNLKSISTLPKPAPPKGITATLRDYQLDGYHWMQFLARHSLHGILADDMGLGKTLQALTHIQAEVSGRRTAKRPTLVVAPTSVVGNWAAEAKKFAPKLKVLVLHGPTRGDQFPRIPNHHLVLTSYALLTRDFEVLRTHSFHLLILDEAQYIKNPASKVAQLVCQLDAAHRLSLSGTPLENHLGELWSQMRFLMPGLLGSSDQFRKKFRSPIERDHDTTTQINLNRRVAPLLLRRTKEEVATELPPKTEIVHSITLHRKQIDLYETVRAAMDKRVRDAIAEKGLAKSHIIVLDALLKLRQICCHPQLLKLPAAKQIAHSAKLDFLTTELLPTLLEEGRRILLFSSFTSMLSLIEEHLVTQGIPFAKITGRTKERQTQIDLFQSGQTPVFLISLKAGGTGLNLTAADTVIHYDPWWNPSAENQATDRAHRIGQRKPVFVHKLICEGSIEQRIQELQSKKAALVDALLTADTNRLRIDQSTLTNLLAPLPAV